MIFSNYVDCNQPLDLRSLATKRTPQVPPPLDLRSLATKGTQEAPPQVRSFHQMKT